MNRWRSAAGSILIALFGAASGCVGGCETPTPDAGRVGDADGDEDSGTAEPTDGGSAPDSGAVGDDNDAGDGDVDGGVAAPLRTLVSHPPLRGSAVDDGASDTGLYGQVVSALDPAGFDEDIPPHAKTRRRVFSAVPRAGAAVMFVEGMAENPNGAWVFIPGYVEEGTFEAELWLGFVPGTFAAEATGVRVSIGGLTADGPLFDGLVDLVDDPTATATLESHAPEGESVLEWHRFSVVTDGFVGRVYFVVDVDPGPGRWVHAPSIKQGVEPSARSARVAPRALSKRERKALGAFGRRERLPPPSRPGGSEPLLPQLPKPR